MRVRRTFSLSAEEIVRQWKQFDDHSRIVAYYDAGGDTLDDKL